MANSLHDQFLKVGLIDKKKLKKAQQDQRKKYKQERRSKTNTADNKQLQAEHALASKVERDRQLNRKRQEKAERKAIVAQIRQLIEANRQPQEDSEIPYNFIDNKHIKRIYVSEDTRKQLSNGRLAITKLDNQYEIVPATIAEKIRIRDEKCVILLNSSQQGSAEEDAYPEYRVPDDLIW